MTKLEKTYLFYDIETTGLNKAFDQVLQFAAIRTDMALKEIERHNFFVKLNPDLIPSPEAMLTHGITFDEINSGECEYDAIKKIHRLLNKPGTISLGYNTLGFDDEFLRFSFYRNLLTPYTHQYANRCSRMDLYPMAIMYWLFKPDILSWPKIKDKVSLKLENLNKENNLASGNAHDAMVDVEATLALAKILQQDEKMWDYLCGYFNKAQEEKRLLKLPTADDCSDATLGIMVLGQMGNRNRFCAPVIALGQHWHYKNQNLWLRLDLPELQQTKLDDVEKTCWVMRKKMAEPGFILPFEGHYLEQLEPERIKVANENLQWLGKNKNAYQAIRDYYLEYKYPAIPNLDVEAALYEVGFFSGRDQGLCNEFHNADWQDKVGFIEQFTSSELRELAIRVIARNSSIELPKLYKDEYHDFFEAFKQNQPIIDYREQQRLSPEKMLARVQELKQEGNQEKVLDELVAYGSEL